MSAAPVTLEGWYVLHQMYALDWPRWNALGDDERDAAVREAIVLLETQAQPSDGHSACWTVLTHKADLCLVHWRRDLESLAREEWALARTHLRAWLVPTYSYLSVIELGTYELAGHAAARLKSRGLAPGTAEYNAALTEEMRQMAAPRLYPKIPSRRYLCFYPMSKRRGEQVNWFDLPAAERGELMRGHGEIGRKYAGQVTQVIAGSVGFDDWEWGVTLFADDPLVFKKLIYEMRFDPASSRYALFGPFYVGIRFAPAALGEVLRAGVPDPRAGAPVTGA
jgi:chlorite dismutase